MLFVHFMFRCVEQQQTESRLRMNIDTIIDLNRTSLLRLLAGMFAVVGIDEGGSVGVVQRSVRLLVLRLLGPAEAAVRRLVFLKARDMPIPEHVRGPKPDKPIPRGKGRAKRRAFPLFDKRKPRRNGRKKRPRGPGPRIRFFDERDRADPPVPPK